MTETELLDLSNWQKVVELIRAAFQEGRLVEESMRQTVVLISKGGGGLLLYQSSGSGVESGEVDPKSPHYHIH